MKDVEKTEKAIRNFSKQYSVSRAESIDALLLLEGAEFNKRASKLRLKKG